MNTPLPAPGPRTPAAARIACVTLGCAKNLVDSEAMLGILHRAGHSITAGLEEADIAVVNTCSFIEAARQESIDAVLEVAAHKGRGRLRAVVVAGCLAQHFGAELLREMPEIDAVVGTGALDAIGEVVGDLLAGRERRVRLGPPGAPSGTLTNRVLATPSHYAYLKIAEGCDHRCAFCIIPALRGPLRSRPAGELLQEAERLAAAGVRELNLISQDTTAYGSDGPGGRRALAGLLERLDRVAGLGWIRLLYTHPALWSPSLMAAVAGLERVVPYVDVPIQHVTDHMLRIMNRGISERRLRQVLERLRQRIPGVALRTTVIVGHPGESEADFEALLRFLADFRFERLGVFGYSRERGTPAGARRDQLEPEVIADRQRRLAELAERLALARQRQRLDRVIEVMIDGPPQEGRVAARSSWDAPEVDGCVWVRGAAPPPGSLLAVRVQGCGPHDLVASPAAAAAAPVAAPRRGPARSPLPGPARSPLPGPARSTPPVDPHRTRALWSSAVERLGTVAGAGARRAVDHGSNEEIGG